MTTYLRQGNKKSETKTGWIVPLIRRTLDIVLSTLLLLLTSPIIVLAAVAIRLESKGNPFFIQERIGLRGKRFRMLKLRGMYDDARVRYPALYDYTGHQGLDFFFHYEDDPRLTRVGAFLRGMSIDELPNFVNVILGDMAVVGPRPEVPDVHDMYGEYARKYLSVKPGITCLSKISGRDRLTKRQSILLDLDYVDRQSLRLDLEIILKTALSVLGRRNVFTGRGEPQLIATHTPLVAVKAASTVFPPIERRAEANAAVSQHQNT